MCHYRGSYVSEDKAKAEAEADRRKEREAQHRATVETLRRGADKAAREAVADGISAKESAPAK